MLSAQTEVPAARTEVSPKKSGGFKIILRRYGVLITLVLLFIVFALLEKAFMTPDNVFNIIRQASILGIMALGLTAVVSVGEFDISFAAAATFAGIMVIVLLRAGVNLYVAWLICIAFGLIISLFNTFTILYLGIPSFIATLGAQAILNGVSKYFTKGSVLYLGSYPPGFELPGRAYLFGIIPSSVIIFLVMAILAIIVLEFSRLGRYIYSVGGNAEAAAHVGINVKKVKMTTLLLTGICTGVAGVVMSSMFGSGNPSMGDGFLTPAIIATFLGAVFLKDGLTNARGAVVAALLLAVLENGFIMVNVPFYMKEIVQGIVLLVAVGMVSLLRGKAIAGVKI